MSREHRTEPTSTRSALARVLAIATGYVGVTTFVLVSYFSIQATHPTPGELLIDRATNAPLWVWVLSIAAAVAAAGVMSLVRQALTGHDRS